MNLPTRAKRASCPSRHAWEAELEAHEPDQQLLDHLENCHECRSLIETLAGDSNWWREASDTLATPLAELAHVTDTICPLSAERHDATRADPLCQHEITQLQAMLPMASHPELLARIGRYELEQLVGRGGMGLVFRARDTELHRVVAVKTLAMYLLPTATARERFIREGRAVALLSHPHIVPVYDVITQPPVPALVMQYIAGPTLEGWIEEKGSMRWQDALRIGMQLADALSAAHAEGLVHRDLKPSNVLLEADGARASLTDFGLVRAIDSATLTHSGMLAGTPHFMSPEQARGAEVDGRSDLFSLGSLLYFAMTGQPPFRGRESMAVLHSLCHSPHVPLCRVDREIPVEVSRLVDRLLAKPLRQRPASSRQVRDELRTLLSSPRRLRRARSIQVQRRWAGVVLAASAVIAVSLAAPSMQSQGDKHRSSGSPASTPLESSGFIDVVEAAERDAPGDPSSATSATSATSASSDRSDARTWNEFEVLAQEVAEVDRMLDRMQPDHQPRDASPLWPTFEAPARQAASIEAELDRLDAMQRDAP